jgi:hypothetical protein
MAPSYRVPRCYARRMVKGTVPPADVLSLEAYLKAKFKL